MNHGNTKVRGFSFPVYDASNGTKKKFRDKCKYYEVPCFIHGDKDTLGAVTGKAFRAIMAVTDPGFAKEIMKLLSKEELDNGENADHEAN